MGSRIQGIYGDMVVGPEPERDTVRRPRSQCQTLMGTRAPEPRRTTLVSYQLEPVLTPISAGAVYPGHVQPHRPRPHVFFYPIISR